MDCEFPQDDASSSNDSEHQMGCKSLYFFFKFNVDEMLVWRMKHHFGKDIYNSIADSTLTAHTPSYNTILDLDRKVRENSWPARFNPYVTKDVGLDIFHSSSLSLRDFYASQHRTVS